jgi:hypothetical protein
MWSDWPGGMALQHHYYPADKIGATPHPPARFRSKKLPSLDFLQSVSAARAAGGSPRQTAKANFIFQKKDRVKIV